MTRLKMASFKWTSLFSEEVSISLLEWFWRMRKSYFSFTLIFLGLKITFKMKLIVNRKMINSCWLKRKTILLGFGCKVYFSRRYWLSRQLSVWREGVARTLAAMGTGGEAQVAKSHQWSSFCTLNYSQTGTINSNKI